MDSFLGVAQAAPSLWRLRRTKGVTWSTSSRQVVLRGLRPLLTRVMCSGIAHGGRTD